VTPESFVKALDHLDPGSRALLDLSLHRGMEDREIAELLGSDPDYVSSSREAAIAQIADDLGLHGDGDAVRSALAEMGADAWRPRVSEHTEPAVAENAPERPRHSQRRLTLFVLLVVAAVAAAVIAAGGGSKSTTSQKPAPPPSKPAPTPAPSARHTANPGGRLTPLSASSQARGTARLSGRNLSLRVSGLSSASGSYEVWLYNDEIDAVPVTTLHPGVDTVTAKLPVSPAAYRYLDISLEPADGNPNHSGQSVLRAPLRSLR
jgi:hypothetical protein